MKNQPTTPKLVTISVPVDRVPLVRAVEESSPDAFAIACVLLDVVQALDSSATNDDRDSALYSEVAKNVPWLLDSVDDLLRGVAERAAQIEAEQLVAGAA